MYVKLNVGPNHVLCPACIQDFHFDFSDLRAGGTKRAGDVTVENFEKKVDQTLHKINTYHSPHVNHAWK